MRAVALGLLPGMFTAILATMAMALSAQGPAGQPGPGGELIRQGVQLDLDGKGAEARAVFQKAIEGTASPAAKANAQRAIADVLGL
jgi:hypothetical protein